jgi:kanosamine 6-kinase
MDGNDRGYLGIDIGGTKVALQAELVAADGQLSRRLVADFRWSATASVEQDLAMLADAVAELVGRCGRSIEAVGVAVPATCDAAGIVRAWPNRPSWVGLNLAAEFDRLFPASTVNWADDGDLAALGEAAEAGCANLLYLGVGTGIGGGLVQDGRCWPGRALGSFELGHLIIDRAGPRCTCGRRGCVQALASGPATLARAAALRGRPVSFDDLLAGLRNQQDWALTALDDSAAALAAAAVGVCELAHPELVLVGGGFGATMPGYVELVAEHSASLRRPGSEPVPVRPARCAGNSSLRGAMLLARRLSDDCADSQPVLTAMAPSS